MLDKTYPMAKINIELESDVADIEMVSRLYTIIGSYNRLPETELKFMGSENRMASEGGHLSCIIDQMDILLRKPMFKRVFGKFLSSDMQRPNFVNTNYLMSSINGAADVYDVSYFLDGYCVDIIYDGKTDRIIELQFNNLSLDLQTFQRVQLAIEMTEYLNMELVGDFTVRDMAYSSERSHITLQCVSEESTARISITIDEQYELDYSANNNAY